MITKAGLASVFSRSPHLLVQWDSGSEVWLDYDPERTNPIRGVPAGRTVDNCGRTVWAFFLGPLFLVITKVPAAAKVPATA